MQEIEDEVAMTSNSSKGNESVRFKSSMSQRNNLNATSGRRSR